MKNQNFKVSCEVLREPELQKIIGGGVMSWLTGCFKPTQVTPTQTYTYSSGRTVEVRVSTLQERFPTT